MKTKHKIIILLLLLGWFILFWAILFGYFLPIDETKWYFTPYIITSLWVLIGYSFVLVVVWIVN